MRQSSSHVLDRFRVSEQKTVIICSRLLRSLALLCLYLLYSKGTSSFWLSAQPEPACWQQVDHVFNRVLVVTEIQHHPYMQNETFCLKLEGSRAANVWGKRKSRIRDRRAHTTGSVVRALSWKQQAGFAWRQVEKVASIFSGTRFGPGEQERERARLYGMSAQTIILWVYAGTWLEFHRL